MNSNYKKLGVVVTINAIFMFLLTYALIADLDHFYPNINRAYMTIIMVAPMIITMMIVMRAMYTNKKTNTIIYIVVIAVFVTGLLLARTQTPVGDVQFLRSMIPHHSSAILMCEEAQISDPAIIDLCEDIVEAQEREIALMKEMLAGK